MPVKILALIAWRNLQEDFDPMDFYAQLVSGDQILLLSDQKAYPASIEKDFVATLGKLAEEVAALPMEADEEEEAEGPVAITDTDKEEMIAMILDKGSASAEEMIEAVVEVSPDEPAFAGTLELLKEALEGRRAHNVGRWDTLGQGHYVPRRGAGSAGVAGRASYARPFETPEGDVYDQELEIDGFEGDLKSAIYDPLVEDVTDEDPALTNYQPNGESQRCVLKYHHKMEGTFPLCQINPEFFGPMPEIIPITLVEEGKRKQAYVNNTTRLVYGLKDFFKDITDVSGSVFHIEKNRQTGRVPLSLRRRVRGAACDRHRPRSLEILDIRARFESQEMPLFDVITEILEQHRQGMTFAQLVNEVNIVGAPRGW